MNSLLAVLSKLETNPNETLGFASCELLNGYLTGWKSASSSFICPDQDPSLRRFTSWLCSKHRVSTSLDSFAIVQLVAGNDHDAFFLYFEELCAFRELNREYFESQYVNENGAPWDRATLIKSLGRKPPMYLGGKSILRLRGFLDGDAHARIETNPQLHLYADLKIFEKWLNKSHEYNALFRCEAVALVQCGGDTSSAFDWLIEKIELYESSKISTENQLSDNQLNPKRNHPSV